ncbi:aromatic ring-hydroxylating oxygenase subunit alpha [Halomonas sp. NPDC076908]|uniref:aromatic ring-hydroxylating oxygenase subunit alpha n=1 Tax=Halomonas sp. NPDC076908 TaxID=3390567 RepID=UPI003D036727|tara:strand:- start:1121 stop:2485 length:1365 start_codon:yes stop_codon:yes gene_type:complete
MELIDLKQLADVDEGKISREIFVNDKLYQQELERVFSRAWLFVGHESQVQNPGDFFVSRMGEESVILVRDKAHEIHVFLNSCRHRGMKVCRYESGNTSLFTCPYHSWTYATDGKLRGVPLYKSLYEGVLDKNEWSLIEVAKVTNYKGSIWATWDPEAPEFLEYLGDARQHLDLALDCRDGRPGGAEVVGVHKWVFPSNWKYAAENFLGDTYHNPSHRSVDLIGIGPSAEEGVKGRRDNELEYAQHVWISFAQGHGVHSAVQPEGQEYVEQFKNDPEIEEYFRNCYHERVRLMGDEARLRPFVGTIFPNTSFHGSQPRSLCTWHPHSPTETEGWRFFLVDADAPEKVKKFLRHYYMRYSGPAGMTEQDDLENWLYATQASQGTIARRYAFNYQQSLNVAKLDPVVYGLTIKGEVSTQVSEHMPRGFYKRWADYMAGKPWKELLGHNDTRFVPNQD